MLFFSVRAKYVCEHTSALLFLYTNHNRSLRAEQGLTPHSHHTRNKCTLIILYLMPLEVFYQTQIIILSCMYFLLFPWQPTLCSILPLFLYLGGFYRKWISLVQWEHMSSYIAKRDLDSIPLLASSGIDYSNVDLKLLHSVVRQGLFLVKSK